ncbi:MAG: acyl-CoA dehydrogenase family protein [Candidatus Rokubacteria bacterium]|nr:acyl-CoA dehydrogenase family protein [Candidatus Rokubacteria bacterium]MBI2491175.1 acyl-CoA dehydrogenase family protein [Candidatus Rokubacteria bacterium]MBI4256150.1 acyl-CoA dehydrogenase family protein [Candidatus Rokubacteria bacterium]MBI4630077.1 acyl-CoA dehydrogenase family protein [Candidatus Rokubacteria bacterium]
MRPGPFSDEHEMLRKSVRAFVEKEVAPEVAAWEDAGRIPRAFWRRLGELGFLGLEFPAEYGGAGGDFLSSVVLGEEMARCRSGGVAFSVLVHTDMSSPWLTRYGTEAQKRTYLPGIIRGETVCALGITEPGTGSDMAALATRAERRGDRFHLTGSKIFITNGVYGDLYFVAARTGPGTPGRRHEGLSMFLVEKGLPGFTVSRKLDKMGMRASDTAELAFEDCPVPAANLLGVEGRGFQQLAAGLQRERTMAAVLALSGARQALEDTIAYLQQRAAFGEPLAARQVLRHRVADMATELEAARRLTYHAAELYAAGAECVSEVSMAKLFATEVANRVAYHAVQLHGGYGYMREFPVEGFFRDVRLWTIASGTSEVMREIIAKRLLDRPA